MADEQGQTKAILPYLQRADELDKQEPKMAYYCRMHALETCMGFKDRSPKLTGLMRAIMSKLEKDKPGAGLSENDKEYCRNFAETVFNRADRIDRAGRADKSTALTFYAASIFIDVMRHFGTPPGELPEDLVDMQRYAAWKAADIRKALREGRQPTPGNGNAAPEDLLPGVSPQQAAELSDFPTPPAGCPSEDHPAPPRTPVGTPPVQDDQHGYQQPGPASWQPPQHSAGLPLPPPSHQSPHPDAEARSPQFVIGSSQPPPAGTPPPLAHTDPGSELDASRHQPPSHQDSRGYSSVHSFGRSSSVASSADQAPVSSPLQAKFPPGSRVLYDAFDAPAPVRGTVAKVDWQDNKWLYTVALPRQVVAVFEHILAPEYPEGEVVMFRGSDGTSTLATVISTDASHWRPSYTIRLSSGQQLEATEDQLLPFTLAQPARQLSMPAGHQQPPYNGLPSQPQQPPQHSVARPSPPPHAAAPSPGGSTYGSYRPSAPPRPSPPPGQGSARPAASPLRHPSPSTATTNAGFAPMPGFQPSLSAVTEAQKCAKFAASSLGFEDVDNAVKYLNDALKLLTSPSGK